jgi:chromosomal replication initiation ATPase DnaA
MPAFVEQSQPRPSRPPITAVAPVPAPAMNRFREAFECSLPSAADTIHRVVADAFGIDPQDMRKADKGRTVSRARFVAYRLMQSELRMSLPQIGLYYRRHHTSVLHGIRVVERLIGATSEAAMRYSELREMVRLALGGRV